MECVYIRIACDENERGLHICMKKMLKFFVGGLVGLVSWVLEPRIRFIGEHMDMDGIFQVWRGELNACRDS